MLEAVLAVNRRQITKTCQRMKSALGGLRGKRIAIFGLSFKPNTDDVRESPSVALAEFLVQSDAEVAVHDPVAMPVVKSLPIGSSLRFEDDLLQAVTAADALVVATDWNEYKQLDLAGLRKAMRGDLLVDARNLYEPSAVADAGLRHLGIGRGTFLPAGEPEVDSALKR